MDTWKTVSDELESQKKSKEWLARELGIEKIQAVNHWKGRGVPDKYHFDIEALLKKPHGWVSGKAYEENHPTAPVVHAQAAINNVATLEQTIDSLIVHLELIDQSRRGSVAQLMADLVKTPDDPGLREALKALLRPAAFTQAEQKAA